MIDHSITSVDFFTAGRATFTISNGREHYTYKIVGKEDQRRPGCQVFFVNLLTGPCNESNYTYMGMLDPNLLNVRLTRKSRFSENSLPVQVVRWGLKMLKEGRPLPDGYAVYHEGKCCRCGRKLTTPESIVKGIGPECEKRLY